MTAPVVYRRSFIKTAECWYREPNEPLQADVLTCLQVAAPIPGTRAIPFKTISIDLTKSEEELLAAMHSNTRNRIRRAAKDRLKYDFWYGNADEKIDEFCRFFERHSVHLGSVREVFRWTHAHARHGTLDLSRSVSAEGCVLVWHAHYRDPWFARGKYSVSLARDAHSEMRSEIGRANRFQTWEDIRRMKAAGVCVYDLGGWYSGTEDEKLLNVNTFKEEMGGELVSSFHCTRALTAKGALYLWAADLRTLVARGLARGGDQASLKTAHRSGLLKKAEDSDDRCTT